MKLHVQSWELYDRALCEADCKVAFDIGANDGGYTRKLLEHGFEVHAFEPVPCMFEKLMEAHGKHPKAALNMIALSDKAEMMRVTVLEAWTLGNPGDGGLSVKPEFKDMKPFDVQTMKLDDYCANWFVDRVGVIKLDVDGYEFKVLRGGEKIIRKCRPPILCEFGCYVEKLGESPKDFVNFIFDLGYKIMPMDGHCEFTKWEQVEPQWPHHTTFDVMLIPA